MPQPNTKTKYRPLPAALLTLVVLLASTLLIWLAVVRPQLGKGRTEPLCDNFDRSELLADGDTAAQVFTYDKALYTIGRVELQPDRVERLVVGKDLGGGVAGCQQLRAVEVIAKGLGTALALLGAHDDQPDEQSR